MEPTTERQPTGSARERRAWIGLQSAIRGRMAVLSVVSLLIASGLLSLVDPSGSWSGRSAVAIGAGYGCGRPPALDGSRSDGAPKRTPRPRGPKPFPGASPLADTDSGPRPTKPPRAKKTPAPRPEPTPRPDPAPTPPPDPRPTPEPDPEPGPSDEPESAGLHDEDFAFLAAGNDDAITPIPSAQPPLILGLAASPLPDRPGRTPRGMEGSPAPAPSAATDSPPIRSGADRPSRDAQTKVVGVDVSHWNGLVPFDAVRAAGRRFAFIKASQGTSFVDDTFVDQVADADAAGILVGPYHFYDYRVPGAAQAEHLLAVMDTAVASDRRLPPVVDLECFAPFGAADQTMVRRELRAFIHTIYRRLGRQPIIYTSAHMWAELTGGDPTFGDTPLWVACWGCGTPSLPAGWDRWLFWQTGSSILPGVGTRIGEDRFAGDATALRRLAAPPAIRLPSGSVVNERDIQVVVDGLAASHVRVSVAGGPWGRWSPGDTGIAVRLPDRDGRHRILVQGRLRPGVRGHVMEGSARLDRRAPHIGLLRPLFRLGPVSSAEDRVPMQADAEVRGAVSVTVTARCGERTIALSHWDGGRSMGADRSEANETQHGSFPTDTTCSLTAHARDGAGNVARSDGTFRVEGVVTSSVTAAAPPPAGVSGVAHMATISTDDDGASRIDFEGRGAAIVARRGPDQTAFEVSIDGQRAGLLDLWAPEPLGSAIVLAVHPDPRFESRHVIELRVGERGEAPGPGTPPRIEEVLVLGPHADLLDDVPVRTFGP